ncbi:MAG: ATP-binding cassette domain-containing protein, partial [Pseudomonadota bacterium]
MTEFKNVTKRYPGNHDALRNLNLQIEKGELVFLTGHSGAGKSTLLRLIALIERPTRGMVSVNHQDTNKVRPRQVPKFRRQIGMV